MRWVLELNLGRPHLVKLAGQRLQGSTYLYLPALKLQPRAFQADASDLIQALMPTRQALYQLSHLPRAQLFFKTRVFYILNFRIKVTYHQLSYKEKIWEIHIQYHQRAKRENKTLRFPLANQSNPF